MIDASVRSRKSAQPCQLDVVLEKAGARASELADNLQNFVAQEDIAYESFDRLGDNTERGTGTFDYVVDFHQTSGGLVVQESRNPRRGTRLTTSIAQDMGLPEMALMFLPNLQDDYEMKCEATTEWDRQTTWVVHFQQQRDREGRTLSFRSQAAVFPARLKGRAWIATDSGEVMHMETGLMEEIPGANVRHWYLSVGYAPVRFRTRDVTMWLPQSVDAYCEFNDHRTIVYHTFSNFVLSSVQIDQTIEPRKEQ